MNNHDEYYSLRGRNLFKQLSNNGKTVINQETAAALSSDDLAAIVTAFKYLNGEIALKSLQNVIAEQLKREPIETDRSEKAYGEYFKMANDELGYFLYMNEVENRTCDTCKHFDECPAEYQRQQPNYCENWEKENDV